jgi:hypothetical protein
MTYYILNGLAQAFASPINTSVFGGVEITQQEYDDVHSGNARIESNAVVYPPVATAEELLQQAKSSKLLEIEQALYNALEAGYQGVYRAHQEQRSEYAAQLQLLETAKQLGQATDTTNVIWYGKGGATTNTLANYRVWCLQYGLWATTVINTYYAKINAIGSATTIAQVEVITW